MIHLLEKKEHAPGPADYTLTLSYEQRTKSRARLTLDDGQEVGLFLERGTVLQEADTLVGDKGETVRIQAAMETLSTARSDSLFTLARACYHLGNRHIPLQISKEWLRYQHDPVLDEMIRGLGLEVIVEQAPFFPEAGAYGGSASHGHHHG